MIRASLISTIGETGGEIGQIRRFVATVNNQTFIIDEDLDELVQAIRDAMTVERRLTR
jgi:hypothetical protein